MRDRTISLPVLLDHKDFTKVYVGEGGTVSDVTPAMKNHLLGGAMGKVHHVDTKSHFVNISITIDGIELIIRFCVGSRLGFDRDNALMKICAGYGASVQRNGTVLAVVLSSKKFPAESGGQV